MSGPFAIVSTGARRDQLVGAGTVAIGAAAQSALSWVANLSERDQELLSRVGESIRDGGQQVFDIIFRDHPPRLRGQQSRPAPAVEDISSPPGSKRLRGSTRSRFNRGGRGFVHSRFLNIGYRRRYRRFRR